MNARGDTRSRLLSSARPLFARSGYKGTSIRAITQRAGANLGAVTYHFGTKANLYEEVLSSISEPLVTGLESEGTPGGAPLDRIEAVVRGIFAYYASNRDVPGFMLHEFSLDRPLPRPIRRTIHRILSLLSGLVETGQRDGTIVAGSATLLTISVVAQPLYLTLARRPLSEAIGLDTDDPATRAEVVDHVVRFIRRGLAASRRDS